MADVAADDDVDDVLGDVGGVVADAFEVFGDQNQLECREDHGGIFHHVGKQLAEHLIAQAVHFVVAAHDGIGQLDVALHEGVEAVADHAFGEVAHARQIHVGLHLGMPEDAHGGLGDVDGLVADAFEVAIDARDADEEPQIRGHGLLEGQQARDAVVHFDLQFVDGVFLGEHGFRQRLIGLEHGVDGLMDGALREAAHPEQTL